MLHARRLAPALRIALLLGASTLPAALPACAQAPPLPPGTTVPDAPPDTPSQAAQQAHNPLAAAEDQIEARNFDRARSLVVTYLSAHPNDARALFDLGFAEDALNHPDAATAAYQKAIAADPKQFESRLALGILLARSGQDDKARTQLEAATGLDPNPPNPAANAQAYRYLARLLRQKDPAAARDALLKALGLSPQTPDDTLLTAEIAEAAGDPDTAATAYRAVLQAQPDSSPAVAGLTHILLQQKKYAEAEPLLHSALQRDPDDPALNAQMATVLSAQGKQSEALALLEKLHQLKPDDVLLTRMLADSYTDNKQPQKAAPLYAALLTTYPDDAAILSAAGENLIRLERYADARPLLEKAVRLNPADGDAWSGLAFAAYQAHDYSATLQALTVRAKSLPDTPATLFLWATAYDNLHQTKQAVDYYQRFLASSTGKLPDQEWQAQHRLLALGKSR